MSENSFSISKLLRLETDKDEPSGFLKKSFTTRLLTEQPRYERSNEESLIGHSYEQNRFKVLTSPDSMFKSFIFRSQKKRKLKPIRETTRAFATEDFEEKSLSIEKQNFDDSVSDPKKSMIENHKALNKSESQRPKESVLGPIKRWGKTVVEGEQKNRKQKEFELIKFAYLARDPKEKQEISSKYRTQTQEEAKEEIEHKIHEILNGLPEPPSKAIEEIDEFLKCRPNYRRTIPSKKVPAPAPSFQSNLLEENILTKNALDASIMMGKRDVPSIQEIQKSQVLVASEATISMRRSPSIHTDIKNSFDFDFLDFVEKSNTPKIRSPLNLAIVAQEFLQPKEFVRSSCLRQLFYLTIHTCIAKMEQMQITIHQVFYDFISLFF